MKLKQVRALRGPNRWTKKTVLEMEVEIETTSGLSVLAEAQLKAFIPSAFDGTIALNGTVKSHNLPDDSALARMLERLSFSLLALAGVPVHFHKTLRTPQPATYKVVLEYREEDVARLAVKLAMQAIESARSGLGLGASQTTLFDLDGAVQQLRSLDENLRLGPSTGSIVRAAEQRDIPTRRMNDGSLVQLGWGAKQRRILAAESDRTGSIAETIAQDKELTKQLLRAVGVPVPEGRRVESADDAVDAARELGGAVVVKPQYGNQGRGVAVNLRAADQVRAAFEAAQAEGSSIIVERYHSGFDHRILVVGDRMVAAARRDPPQVVGDGQRTIEQLVALENENPRRGEDHATSLSKLRLDAIGTAVLAEQGLTPESVPAIGKVVMLRRNANLSTGGSATDITDRVHPDVAARAVEAARVVGLDICGVDIVATDITLPLEEQSGVVVEVNAAPGLRMHLEPSFGRARPVGEAIVGLMFGREDTGRIPVVSVTGVNGKSTTTRLVGHLFASHGKRVGMTTSDGIYVDGRRIESGDCSGPRSARSILMNPLVDAAALETARGGILREGLGWDRCDVAVVTNIGEGDHLGLNGINTVEELAAIKRVIVENVAPQGYAVLNAADPLTVAMASYCPGKVIFFGRDAQSPVLLRHAENGGRSAVVRNGAVVLADGLHEERVVSLTDVPLTLGGRVAFQVDNVLAAAAAAWGAGVPIEAIRVGLTTFVNEPNRVPARFNLLNFNGSTIIVDYAHNVDACRAVIDAISALPHRRRFVVFSAAGDRRDEDIVRQGELIGDAFDGVILYEDNCNRGRQEGECLALMERGVARGQRVAHTELVRGEMKAVEMALRALQPGDLVLVQADQIELCITFVERYIAEHTAGTRKSLPPATPLFNERLREQH